MRKYNGVLQSVVWMLTLAFVVATCAPAPTPTPTTPPTQVPPPATLVAPTITSTSPPPTSTARPRTRLTIGTGGAAGVYNPYGSGLAALISKNIPNIEVGVQVTTGADENMKLIQSNKINIAFARADSLYDANTGQGVFKEIGAVPVRTLAVLYPNYTHIIASEDSGIKTLADLKGKRVSVPTGMGAEIIANRILEFAGLNPNTDIKRETLTVPESAAALKDKKIDAFFASGGVPTAAVVDLGATPGVKLRFIPNDDVIQKMVDKYGPVYYKVTIPKGAYTGMDADVSVVGVANLLVVDEKFDASLAYDILKMMIDKQSDLALIHTEAKKFGLPQATVGSPIPFHPGAIKFYTEKGITVK